ncbi:hypothetical protein BASA81_005541 [Batrachochytrium salamandrivorans]|nr:hypothetical protein BASA81_005541 [Batrachochytrium salamandrivorans]
MASAASSWPPGSVKPAPESKASAAAAQATSEVSVRKITSSIQHHQAVVKLQAKQSKIPALEHRQPPKVPLTRPSSQQNVLCNDASSSAAVPNPALAGKQQIRPVPPRPGSLNAQTRPAAAAVAAGGKPLAVPRQPTPPTVVEVSTTTATAASRAITPPSVAGSNSSVPFKSTTTTIAANKPKITIPKPASDKPALQTIPTDSSSASSSTSSTPTSPSLITTATSSSPAKSPAKPLVTATATVSSPSTASTAVKAALVEKAIMSHASSSSIIKSTPPTVVAAVTTATVDKPEPAVATPPGSFKEPKDIDSPSPAPPTTRKSLFAGGLATVFAGALKKSVTKDEDTSKAHKDFCKQLLSVHVSPENAEKYTLALFKDGFDHKSKIQFLEEQDLINCGITSRGDIKAILSLVVSKPSPVAALETSKSESVLVSKPVLPRSNSTFVPLVSPSSSSLTAAAVGNYSKYVMLSFNVGTLGTFANLVHNELSQSKSTHCWSCTQSIPVGHEWRDSIQVAVEESTHFVMLINSEWIQSGECQHEYKIALSLYNKTKQPKMLPVVFPSGRKHLESGMGLGIAANFNCIFLEDEDATEEARQQQAVKLVIDFLN